MNNEENLVSSGETLAGEMLTANIDSAEIMDAAAAAVSPVRVWFARISPDATPGWNTLTITGLPAGTRGISVWMTEWAPGNMPHAGGAWFTTNSVQLYDNGRRCRVRFHSSWGSHLPAAVQVIYG